MTVAHWRGRPGWAEINLDHLQWNVDRLLRLGRSGAELCAVVKANAYGHGAEPVAWAALDGGASRLAVACVDEGLALRRAGVTAPILVLGYAAHTEAAAIVREELTPMVATRQLALALSAEAVQQGNRTFVHVKVDTGMGRYGVAPAEAVPFARFVNALPGLRIEGVYTHFANADAADKTHVRGQWRHFLGVLEALRRAGVEFPLRHCANSAATIDLPETHLDMLRPGLALYGVHPSADVRRIGLKPVLSLKARLARVGEVPAGATVSYGSTWTASRPSKLALVPLGYADGWPRHLSNRGQVLIRGERVPVAGRVCMDSFVVDATDLPDVQQDDEVVLIGKQGHDEITVDDVAGWADTVSYDVLTGLGARLPRLYLRDGQVVEVTTLLGEVAQPAAVG